MRRPILIAALTATAALLALWLALPDKIFVFDGVMFAGIVERAVDEWRRETFNARHLLFNPFFMLLRDGLGLIGLKVGAYRLFQIVNSLAGAAALWTFGLLLREACEDDWAALGGAVLLGASWCWGTRATEGQVYMLLAAGCVYSLWAAARLQRERSLKAAIHLSSAFALTVLFHAAAVALAPAVVAALWLGGREGRAKRLGALAACGAAVAAVYAIAFGGLGAADFLHRATDFRPNGGAGGAGAVASFFVGEGGLLNRLLMLWRETGWGLAVMPEGPALAAGLALWTAAAAGLAAVWKKLDERRRALGVVLILAWGGFTALNALWRGGVFFAPVPLAALTALFVLAGSERLRSISAAERRKLLGTLYCGALALAVWNAKAGLLPQSRLENNAGYAQAMFVRDHTVPSSWIVISGLGLDNAKVYLPNFAQRAREVLEYYFDRRSKENALVMLKGFIARQTASGVPIYLLSDLVESAFVHEEMRRRWGVTMPEIQGAFGPGDVILMAKGPVNVYLFAPKARLPELFTVLGYSVLTESSPARLNESVSALKELAALMSTAERARTAALMRQTGWGFMLLWEGFSPYMSPESRKGAQARAERFAAFQKTADFHLRVGNLYKYLGRRGDVIAMWTKAYELSKDPGVKKDLEAFKAGK